MGEEYVGKRMLEMDPPALRKRGRSKRRYIDAVKEDISLVGVRHRRQGEVETVDPLLSSGSTHIIPLQAIVHSEAFPFASVCGF